jgi:MFS family permease
MAMRRYLPLFSGYFAVMALSNAIVPVLPSYSPDASVHGLIYAGYFLGAFLITLPAGILTDRYGRIPFIRLGLAVSLASGLFLAVSTDPALVIAGRFFEGIGAGFFVAAAMAAVNADPGHVRLSGWLMASQNAGLVTGLVLSGWLAAYLGVPPAGIALFALLLAAPALASLLEKEPVQVHGLSKTAVDIRILPLARQYSWLWYSTIVIIGITGVVTSLYPKYSGATSDQVGFWLALMGIATIIAVLICSRRALDPVTSIRRAAVLMAGGVLLLIFSPAGFLVLGAVAGAVIIFQMAFLAGSEEHQGTVMGLYSTFAYLGMALLPAAGGFVADGLGFPAAFGIAALAALSVAGTIGRCTRTGCGACPSIQPPRENKQ